MDALKAVNEIFIGEQVPVTHGVIPSRGTPLDEADAFCEYVRNTSTAHPGLFDVSLHGYTHEAKTDFGGQSEFGGLRLLSRVRVKSASNDLSPSGQVGWPHETRNRRTWLSVS
ncbi:DUF2334 domain-containing protein [Halorubrum miltondacostae]